MDELIRSRAHQIWLDQGCPEGCSEEHWYQAEKEVFLSSLKPEKKKSSKSSKVSLKKTS